MPSPDLEMQKILERLRREPAVDYRSMPIGKARDLFEEAARPWNEDAPAVETRNLTIASPQHAMRARLYLPSGGARLHGGERFTLILYAHGGGWTFGSIDTHDGTMRRLALASGCAVLGMDYRLAPEHPFSAPLDDLMTAIAFAESGALGESIDSSRLALAGDSAGANLALAALLRRRDAGKARLLGSRLQDSRLQDSRLLGAALFYGCYLPDFATQSHASHGNGDYLLSTEGMRWYWDNFLGGEGVDTKSLAAPYHSGLAGLPPLYLSAAGLDPLRDDTVMLAEKLVKAEVDFRFDHVPGVVHGHLRMAGELSAARRSIEAAGEFLADLTKCGSS
ncbi:MAG: alpha/beta hydrolase [Hyphomicrobiales bacterium]